MSAAGVLRIDFHETIADLQSAQRALAQFRVGIAHVGDGMISGWELRNLDAQSVAAGRDEDNGAGARPPVAADGGSLRKDARCSYRERCG
jgi:hypothetical protein